MPNSLTALGLETATQEELLSDYTTAFQTIYGADIDLDSDTPDGQWINILVQAVLDLEDLLTQIYNSFDPDNAIGVVLDQRVAINGIQRKAGTFTLTDITIVTSDSVTLFGLDQEAEAVYTIQDAAGNKWNLLSTTILSAGTEVLGFQSEVPGAVITIPNTITVPVTIVLGVSSVNNPTTYTTLGTNEETDAELRTRRQKSVSLSSQGYLSGLYAALENTEGVTFAYVKENNTGSTDSDGVPGHSIWVIVAGTGTDADIAQAIYVKRNAGCGMYNSGGAGAKDYDVTQVDGSSFTIYWDEVQEQLLYAEFTALSLDGETPPNIAAILTGLPENFIPGPAAQVNVNELATDVQALDPNTLVTDAGFSDATVQALTFSGIAASGTFKVSYGGNSTAVINWNDNATDIQTKIRALSGLSSITVAGSIGSQTVTVTMTGVTDPTLLGYNTSTLQTGGAVDITISFFSNYVSLLSPSAKNYQFIITASQVVILPMIMAAPNVNYVITDGIVDNTEISIDDGDTLQFAGLGGYGDYVYALDSGNGSIDADGLYTASGTGTDVVSVTDEMQNTATCEITVT